MVYKDKHQFIAGNAQFPVAVLGNPATADFELIALGPTELPDAGRLRERISERGLYYVATIGILNGVPQTHLEDPLDQSTFDALAKAYIAHVEAQLNSTLEVSWLQRLHGLQDERHN